MGLDRRGRGGMATEVKAELSIASCKRIGKCLTQSVVSDVLELVFFHTLRSGTGCSVAAPECRLLGMASPSPWMEI